MPTTISTTRLRQLRKAHKPILMQVDLEKRARVRQGTISDWESTDLRLIDLVTLNKFCTALGVGVEAFLQRKSANGRADRKSKHERVVRAALYELEMGAVTEEGDLEFIQHLPNRDPWKAALESVLSHDVPALEYTRACVKAAERGDTWAAVNYMRMAATEEGEGLGEAKWLHKLDALYTRRGAKKGGRRRKVSNKKLKAELAAVLATPRTDRPLRSTVTHAVAQRVGLTKGRTGKRLREIERRTAGSRMPAR